MRNRFWSLILVLLPCMMCAQDAVFSQYNVCSMYLNPSFAGSNGASRLALSYRNQWQGVGGFNSINFSFDQNIEKIKSGIGLQVVSYMPSDIVNNHCVKAYYAYNLQVSDEWFVRVGLGGGVRIEQFNGSNVVLPGDFGGQVQEVLADSVAVDADFAIGVSLKYADAFYCGVSLDHVTLATDSPLKFNFTAGVNFSMNSDLVLTPSILYQNQSGHDLLSINVLMRKSVMMLGVGYNANILGAGFKNMHSVTFLAGMSMAGCDVCYSYDVVFGGLGMKTHGAHEISVVYNFGEKSSTKRY